MSLDIFTRTDGQEHKLGYVPPDPSKQKLRSARTNIKSLVTSPAAINGLIPQDKWTEVDYITGYPTSLINNQGREGACVGASGCGALQRQLFMRYNIEVALSWQYLYDQINGGSDNGANIIDSMQVLEGSGVPLMSVYPKSLFRANQPVTGDIYKEDLAITVTDSLEAATALMLGMLVQVPIYVNNSFENWTADGVAWNGIAPKGTASNHSIYLAGLKKINNTWFFRMVNSWGVQWGPFQNGTCLLPFAGIDNPSMQDDGYCHASTPLPPTGTTQVPSPSLAS